jgi:hypothetical protein
MLYFTQLVVDFQARKLGFTSRIVYVGFVVEKLAMDRILFRPLRYCPVTAPILLTHPSSLAGTTGPSEATLSRNSHSKRNIKKKIKNLIIKKLHGLSPQANYTD